MPSPFPGMDPYLEQPTLWAEFHTLFLTTLFETLVPLLVPRYRVRLESRVLLESFDSDQSSQALPDLSVALGDLSKSPASPPAGAARAVPVLVPISVDEPDQQRYLEIYDRTGQQLVTVVEMLSASNKRPGPDREDYLAKRRSLLACAVHVVEIDLLRAGGRMPTAKPLPAADYYVLVLRADGRRMAEVYPIQIDESVPAVPVPLAGDDPDLVIDLQAVFTRTYDRARYDLTLDYHAEPAPRLSEARIAWADQVLRSHRSTT